MTTQTAGSGIMPDLPLLTPNVGIVGFSEGHVHEAPYGDPAWELWGINRLHTLPVVQGKQFTRWFNLHDLEQFHGQDTEHLEYLKQFPGPVFLRPQDIGKYDIPNQVPFPIDEVINRFGRYFNNTISYLIAYAIMLEPEAIGVYGVDMAQDHLLSAEYSQQRPSCEYFLGLAAGLGITLHLPQGSDMLKTTHLYGFEDPDAFTQKCLTRLQEVGQRKEAAKQQMAEMDAEIGRMQARKQEVFAAINQLDGAMQDVTYFLRNWVPQPEGEPFVSQPADIVIDETETVNNEKIELGSPVGKG